MNKSLKHTLLTLATSGLILSGSLTAAQATQDAQESTPPAEAQAERSRAAGFGRAHALPFGRLALGTSVEVNFYDGDPEAAGETLETLTLTYGEDSEAAFTDTFATARENAAYMTVNVGEQTRTVDLADAQVPTNGRALLPRELAGRGSRGRSLEDGGSVTATFYDGDPETNAQELETLTFTYGEDSEAGFAESFSNAAENAAFVSVTTSPRSYTVDLSDEAARNGGPRRFGERGGRGRR